MVHLSCVVMALLLVAGGSRRSFVETAPVASEGSSEAHKEETENKPSDFDEVKQLQDLKNSFGKTFSVLKAHTSYYEDHNGQVQSHSQTKEEMMKDGQLVARVQQKVDSEQSPSATPATHVHAELDVPAAGVHKVLDSDKRSSNSQLENYRSYAGIQYTPLDMAEYVFWTGDEKGVTLAIEEFLQEGLISREEAISFLQEIKYNLEYLQAHYSQQKHQQDDIQMAKERASVMQKSLGLDKNRIIPDSKPSSEMSLIDKKNSIDGLASLSAKASQNQISDEDYEELLEKLRVADFLYTEYSLEEVIYQLGKVMFAQSLTRGSAEAQEALQKFTNFLEAEAEQGHISRNLEKKVLDVLIAALTDTLAERPTLASNNRPNSPLLQKLLLLSPNNTSVANPPKHT